jgi:hypothetical protein
MTQFIWGLKLEGLKNKISTFNKTLWGLSGLNFWYYMSLHLLVNVDCVPGQGWLCTWSMLAVDLVRLTVYLVKVDFGPGQCWLWIWSALTVIICHYICCTLFHYQSSATNIIHYCRESSMSTVNVDQVQSQHWPVPQSTLTRYTVNADH